MRRKKLRDAGELPELKKCSVCGRTLKPGSGSGKAYAAGLCWQHWRQTDEGKLVRRRTSLAQKWWAVAYFSKKPDEEEWTQFARIKHAITNAYVDRSLSRNGPIVVVWNCGKVTMHWEVAQARSHEVTPDAGDELIGIPEPSFFRDQVDEKKRSWFDSHLVGGA